MKGISIHAPAKGATVDTSIAPLSVIIFQSTLPRRERPAYRRRQRWAKGISIHAPAKGATIGVLQTGLYRLLFQSTLPRRERRPLLASCRCGSDFNPRSREGSDCSMIHLLTNIWSAFNSQRLPTAEPTYTDSVFSRAIEMMPQIDNITI